MAKVKPSKLCLTTSVTKQILQPIKEEISNNQTLFCISCSTYQTCNAIQLCQEKCTNKSSHKTLNTFSFVTCYYKVAVFFHLASSFVIRLFSNIFVHLNYLYQAVPSVSSLRFIIKKIQLYLLLFQINKMYLYRVHNGQIQGEILNLYYERDNRKGG